jgi:hypothetical protein
MFGGHFCSQSLASTAGCHTLSQAPVMSSANRHHLVPGFLPRSTDSITVCIVSAVDLPAVKPYCCGGICPMDARNKLSLPITRVSRFSSH